MKRLKNLNMWFAMLLLATISLSFNSCGDDDDKDNEIATNLAKELVGTYSGESVDVDLLFEGASTIKVTSVSENTVKVEFTSPAALVSREAITINLKAYGEDMIAATEGSLTQLLYSKTEKTMRIAGTKTTFVGTKN
ncbi:hypothetical protein [Dysgonomonas sp. HGC4]|uniref:hypothetical protein n=1 Tax=Dysgonomonas sp. HGC4 TaxID=1658009 RepID=UPI000A433C05|nr:hypothetical protein [Dysgonomonas sp. HGC4]MBD8346563.1 hypothetical protein [Dysgonomonas sp. HGC4]